MVFCQKLRLSRTWAKTLTVCVFMVLLSNSASGAQLDNVNDRGEVSVLRCAESGGVDYEAFINSVLWSEKFTDLFEPIYDVTVRNQCQSLDIAGLTKQQDRIRSLMRTAFLTCNNQNLNEMKKAYYKVTAEIYFVRNLVKGGIVLSVPFDIANGRLGSNPALTDRNDLYKGMKERYLGKFFNERELGDLFLELETKYEHRVEDYIKCSGGTFTEVAKKWNGFKKNFTEDYGGLKTALPGIAAEANELAKEVKGIRTAEVFDGDKLSFKDYARSWVELQVNGVSPQKGVREILEELQKNFPEVSISTLTNYEVLNRLVHAEKTFKTDQLEAEMRANFDLLYGNGSESSELFVHQLDGRDSKDVLGLLEVLDSSVSALSGIDAGLNDVNLRQCVSR